MELNGQFSIAMLVYWRIPRVMAMVASTVQLRCPQPALRSF